MINLKKTAMTLATLGTIALSGSMFAVPTTVQANPIAHESADETIVALSIQNTAITNVRGVRTLADVPFRTVSDFINGQFVQDRSLPTSLRAGQPARHVFRSGVPMDFFGVVPHDHTMPANRTIELRVVNYFFVNPSAARSITVPVHANGSFEARIPELMHGPGSAFSASGFHLDLGSVSILENGRLLHYLPVYLIRSPLFGN